MEYRGGIYFDNSYIKIAMFMITVYLSYLFLFFLHLLMLGGYNHTMAADGIHSSKQENDSHCTATYSNLE